MIDTLRRLRVFIKGRCESTFGGTPASRCYLHLGHRGAHLTPHQANPSRLHGWDRHGTTAGRGSYRKERPE